MILSPYLTTENRLFEKVLAIDKQSIEFDILRVVASALIVPTHSLAVSSFTRKLALGVPFCRYLTQFATNNFTFVCDRREKIYLTKIAAFMLSHVPECEE